MMSLFEVPRILPAVVSTVGCESAGGAPRASAAFRAEPAKSLCMIAAPPSTDAFIKERRSTPTPEHCLFLMSPPTAWKPILTEFPQVVAMGQFHRWSATRPGPVGPSRPTQDRGVGIGTSCRLSAEQFETREV